MAREKNPRFKPEKDASIHSVDRRLLPQQPMAISLGVEIVEGGNASLSNLVSVGDRLLSTSARIYTNSQSYNEVNVASGEQMIKLDVQGEKFETVMAALTTHPTGIAVQLELQSTRSFLRKKNLLLARLRSLLLLGGTQTKGSCT
ncbi:hypothetical protein CYMTET_20936 [Cymbomonas tetramitiformis]|uniref:PDZ domain-containing protein n=1 Tax=Cymbomonas tetramitiformis TaxID=36881 RepID=A0AAE0L3C9_9CHLO|nr:hypothetical protein CYMTET_20936 [Cymbomonas tetramitiformis]